MTIRDYFVEREPLEQREYQRTYERLCAALDEALLEELVYASFVVLKPDAYLRGLVPKLIDAFVSRGIQPVSQKVITFSDKTIDELYMFVKQKYASTWWVMRKGYSMAASLPMLVVGDKQEFPHLSARIRDIVGPTTPLAGSPEHIRYSFAGTNKVFNLVHATDDPAAAAREALVFFDLGMVEKWLQSAKQFRNGGRVVQSVWDSVGESGFVPSRVTDLRYSAIKHRVKLQILDHLKATASADLLDVIAVHIRRLRELLLEEARVVAMSLPMREEKAATSPFVNSEGIVCLLALEALDDFITVTIRNPIDEELDRSERLACALSVRACLDALKSMSTDLAFSEASPDQILAMLVGMGVPLAAYDEIMLHSGWAVAAQEIRSVELG